MIPRLIKLPADESLFLFGARGVGKTTLLKHLPWFPNALYINLLKPIDDALIKTFTVSKAVNNPKNNDAAIIERTIPRKEQTTLT